MNNQWFAKVAVWMVVAMVLFTVFNQFQGAPTAGATRVAYSDFLDQVRANRIQSATIQEGASGTEITAVTTEGQRLLTQATFLDRGLIGDLIAHNVRFDVQPRQEASLLMTILVSWGPMLLLIGVWIYFMRQMQGGGKGGAFSFGKSKARMLDDSANTVTFADVAGCDEAKEEVKEVVDFLKDPQKFQKLGGRIPRGLLLVGPPGTGKTLLAKSIAGEAKVPFFSISGSDFVEMFVGVGAARVRDMFDNAKKNAPCIIFIDEIDAVGRQRGAGLGGGNDEREQTLNQMLVEMDGFETNLGVIVVAATNRPDILDAALLRPGRFDRQVYVTLPDIRGREQILNVHMRKVPLGPDVSASVIARGTPGMSGADDIGEGHAAALALHVEAAGLHGEEDRRADQQQGDRRVGQQEFVERLFRVGLEHRQREQLRAAGGVLIEQQSGDAPGLVRYPVTLLAGGGDVNRIGTQRGAGNGAAAQVTHQPRQVTAVGFPAFARALQLAEHGGSRAGGGAVGRCAGLYLPEGGSHEQQGKNGQHKAAATLE